MQTYEGIAFIDFDCHQILWPSSQGHKASLQRYKRYSQRRAKELTYNKKKHKYSGIKFFYGGAAAVDTQLHTLWALDVLTKALEKRNTTDVARAFSVFLQKINQGFKKEQFPDLSQTLTQVAQQMSKEDRFAIEAIMALCVLEYIISPFEQSSEASLKNAQNAVGLLDTAFRVNPVKAFTPAYCILGLTKQREEWCQSQGHQELQKQYKALRQAALKVAAAHIETAFSSDPMASFGPAMSLLFNLGEHCTERDQMYKVVMDSAGIVARQSPDLVASQLAFAFVHKQLPDHLIKDAAVLVLTLEPPESADQLKQMELMQAQTEMIRALKDRPEESEAVRLWSQHANVIAVTYTSAFQIILEDTLRSAEPESLSDTFRKAVTQQVIDHTLGVWGSERDWRKKRKLDLNISFNKSDIGRLLDLAARVNQGDPETLKKIREIQQRFGFLKMEEPTVGENAQPLKNPPAFN